MKPKLSAIFIDIHGTILPKFSRILDLKTMKDAYMDTATSEFKKLNMYCKTNNIRLIVLSGGTFMEVNELMHFFKLDVSAYYCEQGAIYSLDGGVNWRLSEHAKPQIRQWYLAYIEALQNEFAIEVLDMSYRIIFNLVCDNDTYEKFKIVSKKYNMNVYPIGLNENKLICMAALTYINKYNAIRHYMAIEGLNESEILFYGNGSNDIDAFINGNYHKLVSTTPEFFFEIDNTYENVIDKLKLADDLLVYGLTKYLGI